MPYGCMLNATALVMGVPIRITKRRPYRLLRVPQVFHAGTARNAAGDIVASGGRVLNVTALGKDVQEAQAAAYRAVKQIQWDDGFYRNDIGWRAIARSK